MWYELQYKKGFYGKKWWTSHVIQDPKEVLEYIGSSNDNRITINDIYNLKTNEILNSKFWGRTSTTNFDSTRRVVAHGSKPEHNHV